MPSLCIKDFDGERQYFHTLRLTSELVDLRAGNTKLIFDKAKEQDRVNLDAPPQKQKRHPNGCRFCGGASRTRTLDRPVMSR